MNKLFILLVVGCLFGCETQTPLGAKAETITTGMRKIEATEYYISGIHYKIFLLADGGLFILNITKDSLEIINLQKTNK